MSVSVQSPRKVGIIALLITGGAILVALPVAFYLNIGAAIAVTMVVAVPTLYFTWRKYADDQNKAREVELTTIADELALAVQHRLSTEGIRYQRNDPLPMRLSWKAAPADLVSDWSEITALATAQSAGRSTRWARGPSQLARLDGDLAKTFDSVPSGRLVVLGKPGSGKSTLLTGLLQTLLDRRQPNAPVPVMFSLTSWNPRESDLRSWLLRQLRFDYPILREQVPATRYDRGVRSRADALLATHLVLPILDGFDEIPERLRENALESIGNFLRARDRLILSSRTEDYRQATRSPGRTPTILTGLAGIELQDVPPDVARGYLLDTAHDGPSKEPWNRVFAGMSQHPQVAEVMRTPLMIDLARAIYNPRPSERGTAGHRPDELLQVERYPTSSRIKRYLFTAYLHASYTPGPMGEDKWTEPEATHYLRNLARHLNRRQAGTTGFAWWELSNRHGLPTRRPDWSLRAVWERLPDLLTFGLVSGLGFGVAFGFLFGPAFGVLMGTLGGLFCALGAGLVVLFVSESADPHKTTDPDDLLTRDRTAFLTYAFVVGPLSGISLGLVFRLFVQPDAHMIQAPTQGWLAPAGAMGLVIALVFKFGKGMARRVALGVCSAITIWVTGVLVNQPLLWMFDQVVRAVTGHPQVGTATGLVVGTVLGAAAGVALAWSSSAWGSFTATRFLLAARRDLPLRLMTFLKDAHRRGVLRRVGAYYHFRNQELQQSLAAEAR